MKYLIYTVILFTCTANSYAQMKNNYYLKDTVELSGTIRKGRYLSRISGDDKEYFNDAYHIDFKKPVTIIDKENGKKEYTNISHIEIINPYECNSYDFYGNEVVIIGVLDIFVEREGYYRQYSTSINVDVLSIKVIKGE